MKKTLQQYIDASIDANQAPIPLTDPIFSWAKKMDISMDMVGCAWFVFKQRFIEDAPDHKQKDWKAHFRNAVRRNWYRLWYVQENGNVVWTSYGNQIQKEMRLNDV